ncbi:8972_t:CDS:2, partial [Paraglomus occultum]
CVCMPNALTDEIKEKICFQPTEVIAINRVPTSYHFPMLLQRQKVAEFLANELKLDNIQVSEEQKRSGEQAIQGWKRLIASHDSSSQTVTIALVSKYQQNLHIFVNQSLEHACVYCGYQLAVKWIDGSDLEPEAETAFPTRYRDAWDSIANANGIIVPDGFVYQDVEGAIAAVRYAREHGVPFLGIGLGFQAAVLELHATCVKLQEIDSNSQQSVFVIDKNTACVQSISFCDEHEGLKSREAYRSRQITERYLTQYKIASPKFLQTIVENGMFVVAGDDSKTRVDI